MSGDTGGRVEESNLQKATVATTSPSTANTVAVFLFMSKKAAPRMPLATRCSRFSEERREIFAIYLFDANA
jgi:hypothetical protein